MEDLMCVVLEDNKLKICNPLETKLTVIIYGTKSECQAYIDCE